MSSAIEPCPFCTGPAVASAFDAVTGTLVASETPLDERVSYEAYVWCHSCGAQGPRVDRDDLAVFEQREVESLGALCALAVERWNSRAVARVIEGG